MIRGFIKFSVVALLLLIVAALGGGWYYQQQIKGPLKLEQAQELQIVQGDSLNRVASRLRRRGIIQASWPMKLQGLLSPSLTRLQVGTYELTPGMTPCQLLAMLSAGREKQFSVTLIEGETLDQWLTRLFAHPRLRWTSAGEPGLRDHHRPTRIQVLAALSQAVAPNVEAFEGRLFPETYYFTAGSQGGELLQRAFRQMQQVLTHQWAQRQPNLPLNTPYEALILASIIEKETGLASERALIASVFINRLNKKMRLQTDPTVIYGLGSSFDGDLTRRHLRQKTPYNTYKINGLPPTPIAMPGLEAIRAALQPASSDYLYFVARGDGSHHFSTTLAEHNRAVRRFQLGKSSG